MVIKSDQIELEFLEGNPDSVYIDDGVHKAFITLDTLTPEEREAVLEWKRRVDRLCQDGLVMFCTFHLN